MRSGCSGLGWLLLGLLIAVPGVYYAPRLADRVVKGIEEGEKGAHACASFSSSARLRGTPQR